MIEILILYVLSKRDLTLYSICKHIKDFFGFLTNASLGTISPAVKRLVEAQSVKYVVTSSEGGKPSKICMITDGGKRHLRNLLLHFECDNPLYIINYAKAVLVCAEVLGGKDKKECAHNLSNILSLFSIETQRKIDDPYATYTKRQLQIIELQKKQIDEFLKFVNSWSEM